ncbi:10891_t:CDS:2, partial [Funneliformis geosporum]
VDNALAINLDIDGAILKAKAKFFAKRLNIDDFNQSKVTNAPSAKSIANDHVALQQLLLNYEFEDIWNADETGLFWKMKPSRTLAHSQISDQELERLFTLLSQNDHFSAYEYIHIENNEIEGRLTDDKILKAITDIDEEEKEFTIDETIELEKVSYTEAEKVVNTILRFLFEQEAEFGKVEEDVKF